MELLIKKWRAEANDLGRRLRSGSYIDQQQRAAYSAKMKTLRACIKELKGIGYG